MIKLYSGVLMVFACVLSFLSLYAQVRKVTGTVLDEKGSPLPGATVSVWAPQVTLVGGEWTMFSVTLASIGNPASLSEVVIQSAGFTGTVFIDHVGLR